MPPEIPFKEWERYKSKLEISMSKTEIDVLLEKLMLYKEFLLKRSDINDFLIERKYSKRVCKLIHTLRKKIRRDDLFTSL